MDKPSPNQSHLHDWLGAAKFAPRPLDPTHFDPRHILGTMSAGFGPMKALTMQQMELVTLASQRAQAYLGVPQRLARCRTQNDLLSEQVRFWQTAMTQYQQSAMRIFEAWSDVFGGLPDMRMPTAGVPVPTKNGSDHGEFIRVPAGGTASHPVTPARTSRTGQV